MRFVLAVLLLLWPLQALSQSLPQSLSQALPQSLPDPLSDTVSDFAGLLPPETEARIAEALRKGREDTGVQVVLVTLDSLANHGGAGQQIELYAKTLFNHWGVGDALRDDGILILIARDDRAMRIALGAGYDSVWDNAAQRLIDRVFLPAFRTGDYAGGIEAGIPATFDLIARPFVAGNPPPPGLATPSDWLAHAPAVITGALITMALGLILRRALGDGLVRFRPCPQCGRRHLSRHRDVIEAATKTAGGHGLMHTRCASCGYSRTLPYHIPRVTPASSGGFGGGSSSGGGATGRW